MIPQAYNLSTAISFAKANRNADAIYVTKWGFGRIGYQLERMSFVNSWSLPLGLNTRRDPYATIDKQMWYELKKVKQRRPITIMGIPVKVIK